MAALCSSSASCSSISCRMASVEGSGCENPEMLCGSLTRVSPSTSSTPVSIVGGDTCDDTGGDTAEGARDAACEAAEAVEAVDAATEGWEGGETDREAGAGEDWAADMEDNGGARGTEKRGWAGVEAGVPAGGLIYMLEDRGFELL